MKTCRYLLPIVWLVFLVGAGLGQCDPIVGASAPTDKFGADVAAVIQLDQSIFSVRAFGAKGDGKTDDTAAFQAALDAAGKQNGGTVFVPTGAYRIATHLSIPAHVTLEGVFRTPDRTYAEFYGSVLYAYEGKGKEDGTPFIQLHSASVIKGLTIVYPEQSKTEPVPYPWTIRGSADNNTIIDMLIANPWNCVDFGTNPCGRHLIRRLFAQPLNLGLFVDKCFDTGRIEDIHFWPFWAGDKLSEYTLKNATAFKFARSDWELISGCFCISYKVGWQFTMVNDGPGNELIMNSGADGCPTAVLVDYCWDTWGLSWSNCQFFGNIDIKETNGGPVKFTNCGFWGKAGKPWIVSTAGTGTATFSACLFNLWDREKIGDPAIYANSSRVTVTGCEFLEKGKKQITLGPDSKHAIITSNQMRGGKKIDNLGKGELIDAQNTTD